jgi:hypothetical protein
MSAIVLVTCRDCAGTGLGEASEIGVRYQCVYCLGGGHIAVDRTADGGVPDQYREWRSSDLGPTPLNPLRLTYAHPR